VGTVAEDKTNPQYFVVPKASEFMKGSSESQSISVTLWMQFNTMPEDAKEDIIFWIANNQLSLH
jgi:hypothetical protein